MSDDIGPEIAAALVKLQSEVGPIKGNALNSFLKKSYADLEDIILVVKPKLAANGLAVVQMPSHIEGKSALRTMVMHESGQFIQDTMPILLPETKAESKDQGSGITYLRRYAYLAALGLVTTDDQAHLPADDARSHMGLKNPSQSGSSDKPATGAQKTLILKLASERGFDQPTIQARLAEIETSTEASVAIKTLQDMEVVK